MRRTRRGITVRLSVEERDVLRSALTQLRDLLDSDDDPGLRRLYPTAYAQDVERDREYQQLVHDDLRSKRMVDVGLMLETLDAQLLDDEQLAAWMSAVNGMRLVLGTKLDVSEDQMVELDPEDPTSLPYALYEYLNWLLDGIVAAARP